MSCRRKLTSLAPQEDMCGRKGRLAQEGRKSQEIRRSQIWLESQTGVATSIKEQKRENSDIRKETNDQEGFESYVHPEKKHKFNSLKHVTFR